MIVDVEKKFAVDIVYNGVTKSLRVEPDERVSALLQKAIATFGITQQPHLLSLFRMDGSVVPEDQSVGHAGLKPGEVLLLRPNAVKGGGAHLRLAVDVMTDTFRVFQQCGRGRRECAVFWTGPVKEDLVDGVEHPVHRSSSAGYQVDDCWLTELWKRLAKTRRSIKVQVHTHPGPAFHSATDDQWPVVSQAGFVSIVIPDFGVGTPSLERAWVGQLQPDGTWLHLGSATDVVIA